MSLLTDYLAAENKWDFFSDYKRENEVSDAYMTGRVMSILSDMVSLVGPHLALELSVAKDRLDAINSEAWAQIRDKEKEDEK